MRFAIGAAFGFVVSVFAVFLGAWLGVPDHAPPGFIDLTDFLYVGALVACGLLAARDDD